jgi:broad specificity phosphatase PhoE
LKDKNIDCIYASDILRIKQTIEIVAEKIGFDLDKVIYDERMRDINWGVFGGQKEADGWKYYNNDYMKRYEVAPPGGESWKECQERMVSALNSIEEQQQSKTILIVSHATAVAP